MGDEGCDHGDLRHGDGDPPNGAATTPEHDPLDLLCLTRRAALRDCVVVAVCLVSALLSAWLWSYTHASRDGTDDAFTLSVLPSLIFTAIACVLAAFLTMAGRWNPRALGLRTDGMARQALWGIGGVVLAYAAMWAWIGAYWSVQRALFELNVPTGLPPAVPYDPWRFLGKISVGNAVVLLAVASTIEEILFRGLLLPRLRRITGRWWSAVAICALLFGLAHAPVGFARSATIAAFSVAFSIVFIRSRSLIAAATAHTLFNIAQYALYYRPPHG